MIPRMVAITEKNQCHDSNQKHNQRKIDSMRSPSTFVITLLGFAAVASTNREANELSISKATNTSQTFHLQMKVTHGNIR